MALTEKSEIDRIEVVADGVLQVRRADSILRDGVPVGKPTYHRHVLEPGAPLDKEDPRVAAIASAAWTPEVIQAWKDRPQPPAVLSSADLVAAAIKEASTTGG